MDTASDLGQKLLNRVPEITIFFWVIKILGTTVGETAADFLNVNLNLGLTITSILTGLLLIVALFTQFKAKKYVPSIYWTAVVLVSVFGTLVTDNLTDSLGIPLEASTLFFSVALALTFGAWYLQEKTLSIHSIVTAQRESFYWLAILFTFALGTAAGDLLAEGLGLGYFTTGVLVAVLIAAFAVAWRMGLNSILAFWAIYILTRPLGASLGDLLSQPGSHGGLGLGATLTSLLFVVGIFAMVAYLSLTKRDVIQAAVARHDESKERGGVWQTILVLVLFLSVGSVGYYARHSSLQVDSTNAVDMVDHATSTQATFVSPLGDMSTFKKITQDTLDTLNAGDQSGATKRIGDLEYEWDNAQSHLRSKDRAEWTKVDGKIDTVLRELRAVNPNLTAEKAALQDLLAALY